MIQLPPGVTKRSIDTLISRRIAPFALSGSIVVECLHGREKRSVVELEFDPRGAAPLICPCCENLFRPAADVPHCPACTPRRPPT